MAIDTYKPNMPKTNIAANFSGVTDARMHRVKANNIAMQDVLSTTQDIMNDYHEKMRKANALATETELTRLFSQRTVDVQSSRKMGDTQGLLDDESAWVDNAKEAARKASKLNDADFDTLWNDQAARYLKATGAYQLAEGAKYEEASKKQYVDTKTNQLATAALGDLSMLDTLVGEIGVIYKDDPDAAKEAISNAVEMQFTLQAMNDPRGTLNWYNANKGLLIQKYQGAAADIDKVMKKVDSNLRSQMQLALAFENRALQLEARAQEQYDNAAVSNMMQAFYGALDSSDSAGISTASKLGHEYLIDPNLSTDGRKAILSIVKDVNKLQTGGTTTPAMYEEYMRINQMIMRGEATQDDVQGSISTLADMGASKEFVNGVYTSWKSYDNDVTKKFDNQLKLCDKAIEDAFSVTSEMGMKVTGDPMQILHMQQAYRQAFREASPEERVKMLDLADPNGHFAQFIRANKVTTSNSMLDTDSIRAQREQEKRSWKINWPEGMPVKINATYGTQGSRQMEVQKRLPGESPEEYMKRMGIE